MKRRSFLKGLAASAALALSRLLPPLAPENDWGSRGRSRHDDYQIGFRYVYCGNAELVVSESPPSDDRACAIFDPRNGMFYSKA